MSHKNTIKLSELLDTKLDTDITVSHITDDTRTLSAGDVFVFDTRNNPNRVEAFIAQAKAKGAAAIIMNIQAEGVIYHAHPGKVLATWAKHIYPRQPQHVVAVTGTNGKTSVAWFYNQLLNQVGIKAASIGTLGIYIGNEKIAETGYTSPTSLTLHKWLHELAEKGVTHVCLEASSHALALGRLDGVTLSAAGFTNFTQDHLDFHGTMDEYFCAKQHLFTALLPHQGSAIINIAHETGWVLASNCKETGKTTLTVGPANAELVVSPQNMGGEGVDVCLKYNTLKESFRVPLVGAFQTENIAVCLGLIAATEENLKPFINPLKTLQNVPGRMMLLAKRHRTPTIIIDYAHTPDALMHVLKTLRPITPGKLWVVFGCGGDRDTGKRPLMGDIAAIYADEVVITDDNPRTENAEEIRAAIAAKAPDAHNVGDRKSAIQYAITHAVANDTVLIAGKGHEEGQIVGKTIHPFNDYVVANAVVEEIV